jgi:hypothetical protein
MQVENLAVAVEAAAEEQTLVAYWVSLKSSLVEDPLEKLLHLWEHIDCCLSDL